MPPQSRGDSTQTEKESTHVSANLTSQVHLDSPPAPGTVTPGQATPTGFRFTHVEDDNTPTPVRPRFQIPKATKDESLEGDEEEEEQEEGDEDSVDDDDEFESHYSRQDSSASSEEDEDEEQSDTGDEVSQTSHDPSNIDPRTQRIASMPSSVQASRLHLHHSYSTTSLPRAAPPIPPPLYPPFYNRPPTPLPPSPSLTSLLRPPSLLTRSTHTTQPPTPDYSDDEHSQTPNDTEAAVAHSARRAHVLPPTAPKVPTYEYYGFTLYLFSTIVFALYILWSYLPSPFLHRIGITYYPDRWWSLAIPAWIVMLLIYIYIALSAWNVEYMTLQLNNLETMVDEAGNVAILDPNGHVIKGGSKKLESDLIREKEKHRMFFDHHHYNNQHHNNSNNTTTTTTFNSNNHNSYNSNNNKSNPSTKGRNSTTRKKDRRRREKERERGGRGKDNTQRFGYMGDVVAGRVANGLTWMQIWNEGTDAVMDVPIGGVCEVLYGDGSDF